MFSFKSIVSNIAVPLGAVLLLSACAAAPSDGGGEAAALPLRIGGLAPLSGDGSTYGIPLQRVAEYAAKEVNDAGGVLGRPLQIVWEDGGCDGQLASSAIKKLVSVDKVSVVYGGFCSSETLAAAPVTEPAKVILFSPGSSSPDITTAGDFVFRNYPSDSSQGSLLAEHALEKEWKKIGMISEQQDYTLGIQKVFEEVFKAGGGELTVETYVTDASDFRTQITKLKSANVDAVFVNPQTPAKADLIVKQLQEQGVETQLILNDVAIGHAETVAKYAEYLEGAVGAEASYDAGSAGFTRLSAHYSQTFGEDLPYPVYMSTSYDAVYILKEAIEAVGDPANTAGIRDYFYGIKDRRGLAGSLTIDENGDPTAGHILKTVRNGDVEVL